jgi:hypothetical protein
MRIPEGYMHALPKVVTPTYDREHYLARARLYARDAEYEPDPKIKKALAAAERACRRNAESRARKAS